jgi:hypothetical protein
LDLIDANAGGVKLSRAAHNQLLGRALEIRVSDAVMKHLQEDIDALKNLKLSRSVPLVPFKDSN